MTEDVGLDIANVRVPGATLGAYIFDSIVRGNSVLDYFVLCPDLLRAATDPRDTCLPRLVQFRV